MISLLLPQQVGNLLPSILAQARSAHSMHRTGQRTPQPVTTIWRRPSKKRSVDSDSRSIRLSIKRSFGGRGGCSLFVRKVNGVAPWLSLSKNGTKTGEIVFGGDDADVLRKEFTPWPAQTLVDLDNYVALIKPLRHGKVMEPFQIQTYDAPPHIKLQDGRSKSVTNYSRDNYGTPRAEVEAEILRWMEGMGQKASEATLKRIAGTIAPKKTAPRRNRG